MKTELTLEVNLDQIVRALSRDDAMELIQKIDLRFAECDFTIELINNLIKSLKPDMSNQDIRQNLHQLYTD
jgi:hypothetical protein